MKAKLTIDGKEFDIEMDDNEVKAMLSLKTLCEKKKTGYERVVEGDFFYVGRNDGTTDFFIEEGKAFEDRYYECADYHSDTTVAKNNARADKLYRQLRRFAVEHRDNKIDWNDKAEKYYIYYNQYVEALCLEKSWGYRGFGLIFFDTRATAKLAIDTFKDELLWYFTEYKDSL